MNYRWDTRAYQQSNKISPPAQRTSADTPSRIAGSSFCSRVMNDHWMTTAPLCEAGGRTTRGGG